MLRFLLLHLPLLAQSAPVVSDRTSLAIGQDRDSVISYMRTFGQPAAQYAVMSYTSLANLTGLWTPIDYGSGVEHAAALLDAFPSADLQLGLYIAHTLDEIGNGNMDTQIDKLAEFCRAYATRTFYIRVGYECDGPHNQHKPEPYKVAFRRISQKLKAQTTNVRIVWHSWASNQPNFMNLPTSVWWPGSDVVDWIGVSLFEQVYLGYAGLTAADAVAFWARSNQSKPVMIAESTPKGLGVNPKLVDRDNVWQSWFEPVLMFIERHDIAMWSYINCDWEEQPMWKGGGWGDTRLEVGDQLSMHWQAQVLVQERFARAGYPSKATQIGKQSLTQSSARRLLLILLAATLAAFSWFLCWGPLRHLAHGDERRCCQAPKEDITHRVYDDFDQPASVCYIYAGSTSIREYCMETYLRFQQSYNSPRNQQPSLSHSSSTPSYGAI